MILQKSFYAELMLKKHLLIISMLKTAVLLSMCYVLRKLIYIFTFCKEHFGTDFGSGHCFLEFWK